VSRREEIPVIDVLVGARALVAKKGGWIQRTFQRIGLRKPGQAKMCYCASGAIRKVATGSASDISPVARRALDLLRTAAGTKKITAWNDAATRTQAEVVSAFDAAIELAKKDAA